MDIVLIGVTAFLAGFTVGGLSVNHIWKREAHKALAWLADDTSSSHVRDELRERP